MLPEEHNQISSLLQQVQRDTGWPTFTLRGTPDASNTNEPRFSTRENVHIASPSRPGI